jgi:hypothetical protein
MKSIQGKKEAIVKNRSSWWKYIVLAGLAAFVTSTHANEVVINGGFESGDFAGWTGIGDTSFNGVQCSGPNPGVFEGNCSAFFGPFLSTGGIEQTLDFGSAGVSWNLSFAFQADGGTPSSFAVQLGDQTLLSLTDPAAGDYTLYDFSGISTAATETLAFNFLDSTGFLSLDAISVNAIPEPSIMGLLSVGLGTLFIRRRRKTG